MNDEENNDTNDARPADRRPLGYWLRVVDSLLTREFAVAFEAEGISRRDWMVLSVLAGDHAPELRERLARKGKRLRALEDRGWIEQRGDGEWTLTDLGRAEKERIGESVDGIRSRVVDAVGDDAFATTMASLEAIARELGWDDDADGRDFPRGPGFGGFGRPRPFRPEIRFGWGPNRHRGFGPGGPGRPDASDAHHGFRLPDGHGNETHGHGHHGREGYARGHHACEHQDVHRHAHHGHAHGGHGHHGDGGHGHERYARSHQEHHRGHGRGHHHGHGHGHHRAQQAYERGFDAGYERGRTSAAA